jgi:hypothetical protein
MWHNCLLSSLHAESRWATIHTVAHEPPLTLSSGKSTSRHHAWSWPCPAAAASAPLATTADSGLARRGAGPTRRLLATPGAGSGLVAARSGKPRSTRIRATSDKKARPPHSVPYSRRIRLACVTTCYYSFNAALRAMGGCEWRGRLLLQLQAEPHGGIGLPSHQGPQSLSLHRDDLAG